MSKRGLPASVQMRHDSHYVDVLATAARTIGKTIPVHLIAPNPDQPRREIGDLTELSNSIREKGVLEPLLVKPDYKLGTWMIIAGERRWRASQLAGLTEVPCIEMDLDEKSIAEIALIENLQRKDLTVWEEADGLAALSGKYGYKHDEIAQKISKSRTTVTELMTIAGLPSGIRAKCLQAKISAKSMLLEIARQFDEEAMFAFLENIGKGKSAKRPGNQTQPSNGNGAKEKSSKLNPENSFFRYDSPNEDFMIEISFRKLSDFKKGDVLKALKEAFDNLKIEHPSSVDQS
ncbi:MAG: ParB/RepB/Spo0J family partition protein [Blastocatellia bacterium]|nr:ParB/RepB/Spo0J family partition protein [Blastocatellia bacterium]